MAIRVVNPRNGKSKEIYALLDSGADRDYLSDRVAGELDLTMIQRKVNLVTVEESSRRERKMANLEFESIDGSYKAEVEDVLVGRFPETTRDIPPAKRDCSSYLHLKDIIFNEAEGGVEMIIGAGHAEAWMGGETRMGPTGSKKLHLWALQCPSESRAWRSSNPISQHS